MSNNAFQKRETASVDASTMSSETAIYAEASSLRVFSHCELLLNPALTQSLADFINEGFKFATEEDRKKYDFSEERLQDANELLDVLGDDGLLAVSYKGNLPIACAGVSRWKGDLEGGSVGKNERGWEIKTVTVRREYMKQGLAGKCINALQEKLLKQSKELSENGALHLWIQTAEDVNGDYWRRRGWNDVRAYEEPVGFWGSYLGFRLLILVKEIRNLDHKPRTSQDKENFEREEDKKEENYYTGRC